MQKIKMPNMAEWREKRYKIFNEKINHFAEHKDYIRIRKLADKCILDNEGFGYPMIVASDFIERIEQAPLYYISEWLDGKNELLWKDIERLKQC